MGKSHRSQFLWFAVVFQIFWLFASASGASFSYPDFSSVTGLNLVGDAAQAGNELLLTSTETGGTEGAAWYGSLVDVSAGFQTSFSFRVTNQVGTGADGMAFVIQSASATALGVGGSDLGFGGLTDSVAIEFDCYFSEEYNDPDANHIAVITKGSLANSADHTFALGTVNENSLPFFSVDEAIHNVTIIYFPGTLKVFIDNTTTPVLTVALDLGTTISLSGGTQAYVGFTAGTGGEDEDHRVASWSFASANTVCNFSDSFSDDDPAPNWVSQSATWTETGGLLQGVPAGKKALLLLNPAEFTMSADGMWRVIVNTAGGEFSKIWILGWYIDKKNTLEVLALPEKGKWLIKQRVNGAIVAKTKVLRPILAGVNYNLSLRYSSSVQSGTAQLFIDDLLNPAATMPLVGVLQLDGRMGFQLKNTSASFDSVCMEFE